MDSAELERSSTVPRAVSGRVLVSLALLVLTGAVFAGELASDPRPAVGLLVFDAVVGLVAAASAPWLAARPELAAGVYVALSAVVPTAPPVAATSVLWLARSRPLRVAAIGGVAGVGAQLARGIWRPLAGVPAGWWSLVVALGYAAMVGWGAWMQANRALVASLEERARRAEQEQAARVDEARRAERTRIAREMHDVLAHRLSMLAVAAGALEYHPDAPADEVARASGVIRSNSHLALEELREVIGVLRTDDEDVESHRVQPTLRDLPALVDERRQAGAVITLRVNLSPEAIDGVPAGLGRTVYRIVQESLTNATKHAPGEAVDVAVGGVPGQELMVTVVNRLPAGETTALPGSGSGLVGLGERVHLLDGSFLAGATAAGDHRVAASLPWPA